MQLFVQHFLQDKEHRKDKKDKKRDKEKKKKHKEKDKEKGRRDDKMKVRMLHVGVVLVKCLLLLILTIW